MQGAGGDGQVRGTQVLEQLDLCLTVIFSSDQLYFCFLFQEAEGGGRRAGEDPAAVTHREVMSCEGGSDGEQSS